MKVTYVKFSPCKNQKYQFKGYAKIVLDNILMLSGMRLYLDDDYKPYIIFPDRRTNNRHGKGNRSTEAIANTNDASFRQHLTESIYNEYLKMIKSYKK